MRVYEKILEIINKYNRIQIGDFSKDFSVEEMNRIAQFFVDKNSTNDKKNSIAEYIKVIISEKANIKIKEVNSKDLSEIMNYLTMLKDTKK
jgi:hypothetical protein